MNIKARYVTAELTCSVQALLRARTGAVKRRITLRRTTLPGKIRKEGQEYMSLNTNTI
jgi:hypothetical protein